jgi:hypothetical protein
MAKLPEAIVNKIFSYLEDFIDYGWVPFIDKKGRMRLRTKKAFQSIHNVIRFKTKNLPRYIPLHIHMQSSFDSATIEYIAIAIEYSHNLPLETVLKEDQDGFISLNACYSFVDITRNCDMIAYVKRRHYYSVPYRYSYIGWITSSDNLYKITNVYSNENIGGEDDDEDDILHIDIVQSVDNSVDVKQGDYETAHMLIHMSDNAR